MKKLFVIMMAIMVAMAFAAPAFAASEAPGPSVTVHARILLDFGYSNKSKERTANKNDDVTTAFANIPDHSYFRVKYTSADKSVGGMVEMGLGNYYADNRNVELRYAYGWWKVGNCKLKAGQLDTPYGDLGWHPRQYLGWGQPYRKLLLLGYGFAYSGRLPQVAFDWDSGNFGFTVALVQPMSVDEIQAYADTLLPAGSASDAYATFPRIDFGIRFKAGGFSTYPSVFWAQYKLQYPAGISGVDDSYDALAFQIPVMFTTGGFTAKAQFHWQKNVWKDVALYNQTAPLMVAGKIKDGTNMGGFISLEYKVGALTPIIGYGIEKSEHDAWTHDNGYKDDGYTMHSYFVALQYVVAKHFTIHPEFAYFNYGDNPKDGKDWGNEWLLGVEFRFIF